MSILNLPSIFDQGPLPHGEAIIERFLDEEVWYRRIDLESYRVLDWSKSIMKGYFDSERFGYSYDLPSLSYAAYVRDVRLKEIG